MKLFKQFGRKDNTNFRKK